MDITLAHTFLAVCDVGNFLKAADRLNVTQSTVSARIKGLEELLDQPLFLRSKAGAHLTPSGARFKPFAERFVQTWEQARQEIALPSTFTAMLLVGVEFTLWEHLLPRWLPWMRFHLPDTAVRAEVGASAELMRQLADGLLHVVVTTTPRHRSGVVIEPLMEEELVLVSTRSEASGPGETDFIDVDWGPEFRASLAAAFADRSPAVISVSYGPLALQQIVRNGGSAYLPRRLVGARLDDGTLYAVDGAPTFIRPTFIAHLEGVADGDLDIALSGLRDIAAREDDA